MTYSMILRNILAAIVVLMTVHQAWAQSIRLDDTASPRARVDSQRVISENGLAINQDINARFAIIQFGKIQYVLNTSRFQGQRARIYYVMPTAISGVNNPSRVLMRWTSTGLFANGQARTGQRVPVWTGTIGGPTITEFLDLTVQIPLQDLAHPEHNAVGFEAYFELERLP